MKHETRFFHNVYCIEWIYNPITTINETTGETVNDECIHAERELFYIVDDSTNNTNRKFIDMMEDDSTLELRLYPVFFGAFNTLQPYRHELMKYYKNNLFSDLDIVYTFDYINPKI